MAKKLFEGTENNTPQDNRRIALGYAGILGSEFITWAQAKIQLLANLVSINLAPQSTPPAYNEGTVYYDDVKKALTYFNDSSEIAVNIGQEVLFIVENQTGGLLSNGTVISPDETTVITKADAYYKNKSRIIAVLTEAIADGETGYATKLGQVGGLDTSAYSEGEVIYLGTDGQFTNTTPTDGGYICIVGVVDVSDESDGVITVDTKTSDTTVEVTDTNGFPPDQRAATTILFVDGSRLFTILPTGTDFHFYELGDKYKKTGGEALTISDVTGGHIIYYDSGVLTEIANPTSSQAEHIILNHAIVAYIYWNASTSKAVIVQDERHGIGMAPQTHFYLHQRFGAFYVSGLALESFVIGNGSLSSHAQFGNALGIIKDEDLPHDISAIASTVGLEYVYRTGASGIFTSGTNAGYSFPVGATPLPQYNEWTGATWQLTEVTSGDYMNIHIFANGNINQKPIVLLGTAEYTQLNAASAGQADELSTILSSLPLPEFVLIGSVIIEGKTSFTNAVNARVVENSEGQNYTNWTTTELAAGAAPTNHNNLAGLEQAGSGVTWGHVDEDLYNTIISGGGGHVIQENEVAVTTARANLNFVTANGEDVVQDNATNDSSDIISTIKSQNDFDATGMQAADLIQRNTSDDGFDVVATAPDEKILPVSIEPNLSADGLLSVIIPAGYMVVSITVQETAGNAAGNISIGTVASGTQIVNAFSVPANADTKLPLTDSNGIYVSSVNDTDMYVSSSAWGTGVIQLNFVMQKTI